MSAYGLRFTQSAKEDITRLNKQTASRIAKKLTYFIRSGHPLDFATALTKPSDAQYRWRIGDFRVLFDVSGRTIMVLRVQHRREVYKK